MLQAYTMDTCSCTIICVVLTTRNRSLFSDNPNFSIHISQETKNYCYQHLLNVGSHVGKATEKSWINPLNAELNSICYLLALLAHHFLHLSRIRFKSLTLRLLMSYIYIYIYTYIYKERLFLMFLDHTKRHTTFGRTPLDEWSARRRDLYLKTHDTHNRQISMPPVEFEPTISAGERPQ